MHSISRLVALSALAAGTAIICAAAPSRGQGAAPPALNANIAAPAPPQCCTPEQRPVATDTTWTVQPPTGPNINAVVVTNPNVGWHAPGQGAQWIADVANAGQGAHDGGTYIYRKSFCICQVPKGVASVPVGMYLSILADNSFSARLNSNPPFATGGPTAFISPINVTFLASQFVPGNNVLEIRVTNLPNSPTGLAVSGWVAGYFQQPDPHGARCR